MIVGNECFSLFRRIWLWFHSNLATNWASMENVSLMNTLNVYFCLAFGTKSVSHLVRCARNIYVHLCFPHTSKSNPSQPISETAANFSDESYAIRFAAKIVCVMWNAVVCFSAQCFPFNMLLQAHFVCISMQKRTSTTSARSISIVRFIWPSIFYMAQQPHGLTFALLLGSSLLLSRLYIFQNFMYFVQFCLWVSIFFPYCWLN